jgi:hypothetical protein
MYDRSSPVDHARMPNISQTSVTPLSMLRYRMAAARAAGWIEKLH